MARGISTTTKTELAKDVFRLASLFRLHFTGGLVSFTDYGATITDGTLGTFPPSAHFTGLSAAQESSQLRVNEMSINLSGVDQAFISILLNESVVDRKVEIYRATIDVGGSIVGSPFLYFDGRITNYEIEDTGTEANVTINIASHWSDFEKLAGRKTNANSQNIYFPNDRGMDFSATTTKEIRWGRK